MPSTDHGASPSELIDARIAELGDRVFSASLSAGTRRAIDLREGDQLDEDAFKSLVTAAVAHNARE